MHKQDSIIQLSKDQIRKNARAKFATDNVALIVLRQAFYENWLKVKKRVSFRHNENHAAVDAYCAMTIEEFEGINARQYWANWRTVPYNLSGHLPDRPLKTIDLCSGIGQSTEVLAHYLPSGSSILGLEFNPEFVKLAKGRTYRDAHGNLVSAQFHTQSVLETFRFPDGQMVEGQSIDLINSCGAVGAHFNPQTTERLAIEVHRVLKIGGLALIDSGAEGTRPEEVIQIFTKQGFEVRNEAKSCILDRFKQICFRKIG